MTYVKAQDVHTPKASWTLLHVLVDQGPSTEAEGKWSLAIGRWAGGERLAARWNGRDDSGSALGNPQSRGLATWFVMPPEFEGPLMSLVPPNQLALAKALLKQD